MINHLKTVTEYYFWIQAYYGQTSFFTYMSSHIFCIHLNIHLLR